MPVNAASLLRLEGVTHHIPTGGRMPLSLARWKRAATRWKQPSLAASQRGFQPRDPERARVSKLRPAVPPRTIYISGARLLASRVRSASTPALTPLILLITIFQPVKNLFFVGDEVTSLKSLRFLKGKLETPYVVSCFFNSLLITIFQPVEKLVILLTRFRGLGCDEQAGGYEIKRRDALNKFRRSIQKKNIESFAGKVGKSLRTKRCSARVPQIIRPKQMTAAGTGSGPGAARFLERPVNDAIRCIHHAWVE